LPQPPAQPQAGDHIRQQVHALDPAAGRERRHAFHPPVRPAPLQLRDQAGHDPLDPAALGGLAPGGHDHPKLTAVLQTRRRNPRRHGHHEYLRATEYGLPGSGPWPGRKAAPSWRIARCWPAPTPVEPAPATAPERDSPRSMSNITAAVAARPSPVSSCRYTESPLVV